MALVGEMQYLTIGNSTYSIPTSGIPYGVCSVAADTAAKTVTVSPALDSLSEGKSILVKFTYSNTVANPTLSVNGLTAKSIKRYGTTAPSTSAASSWNAGTVWLLVYDGTYWQMGDWINTTYSSMTEAEITAGTGTTARLITPARLKTAVQTWAPVSSLTLNGSASSTPSFYAPTTAGTSGYFLTSSGSGAPTWTQAPDTGLEKTYSSGTVTGVAQWTELNGNKSLSFYIENQNDSASYLTLSKAGDAFLGNVNYDLEIGSGIIFYNVNTGKQVSVPMQSSNDEILAFKSELPKNTSATLTVNGWSSNTQTVTVSGVDSTNTIIVTYAPASRAAWLAADVYCSAQGTNSLTFTCSTTPSTALTANIIIMPGTVS